VKLIGPTLAIAVYTLLKTPSGWKVVVVIAHDEGVVLVE